MLMIRNYRLIIEGDSEDDKHSDALIPSDNIFKGIQLKYEWDNTDDCLSEEDSISIKHNILQSIRNQYATVDAEHSIIEFAYEGFSIVGYNRTLKLEALLQETIDSELISIRIEKVNETNISFTRLLTAEQRYVEELYGFMLDIKTSAGTLEVFYLQD